MTTPNRSSFTKAWINGITLPDPGKRAVYYDADEHRLALRVTSNGRKTFYVVGRRARGGMEWLKIGTWPATTVEQARKLAKQGAAKLACGESITAERRQERADPTFEELFQWWLAEHVRKRRSERYARDCERQFRLHLAPLAKRRVSQIARAEFRRVHEDASERAPVQANRALGMARAVFNKAIGRELFHGPNPAEGIERNDETPRERRLYVGELARFFEAIANEPFETARDFFLLALFTGARRANVMAMRWEEIDLAEDEGIWRIPMTKNGRPQAIPLEPAEVEILRRRLAFREPGCPWVFPGHGRTGHLVEPKSAWRRVLERAGIADLRIHDLRRTLGSVMADTGAQRDVIGKALNHLSPAATAIYTRLAIDPIRQAKRRAHEAMGVGMRDGQKPS